MDGLKNYSQAQVLAAAGLKVGQLAGKADFEAARDRLVATGVFETVGYHFAPAADSSQYAATFEVVEVGPVYPVRFEGVDAPKADVEAWIRRKDPFFGAKIAATEAILKRDAAAIEEYLAGKGKAGEDYREGGGRCGRPVRDRFPSGKRSAQGGGGPV